MVARAKQSDANGPAGRGKMAGSNETVPAIVAGSTQYGDGTRRPAPFDLARDATAGILHQLKDRRAGSNRQTIGLAHPTDVKQRRR